MLKNGEYTCVLCKDEETITCTERGVKPLLDLLDSGRDLKGFSAADKVVGKAAAFLYVLLGVSAVYARVISETALQVLEAHEIYTGHDVCVNNIINRMGTDTCPMEDVVGTLNSPSDALHKIRQRLIELNLHG